MAGTVQTRSVVQTRTHAQKFFQKASGFALPCLCTCVYGWEWATN